MGRGPRWDLPCGLGPRSLAVGVVVLARLCSILSTVGGGWCGWLAVGRRYFTMDA